MGWRPIAGYEGLYEVSDDGQVRSRKTGHCRAIKPKANKYTGYLAVNLRKNGSCITRTVHRLVAEAFLPNPDGLQYVNHIDEDKTNNRVENLEWCTPSYNNHFSSYKRRKRVVVYSVEGDLLATFESESIAASLLGVSKSTVSQALTGAHQTCSGLVFKFERGD